MIPVENKRSPSKSEFYSRKEIASTYDDLRFGGESGAWVSKREIELVLKHVPQFRRALDLACGTGRVSRELEKRGCVTAIDISQAMLDQAKTSGVSSLVRGNAFALPFGDMAFDAVVALRLVFHFREIGSLLKEVRRVLTPSGVFMFDTYRWSPRALVPLDSARWGGGVFAHGRNCVESAATKCGLRLVARDDGFLFSPYIYRRLPLPVIRVLSRVETGFPPQLRARIFWALERPT